MLPLFYDLPPPHMPMSVFAPVFFFSITHHFFKTLQNKNSQFSEGKSSLKIYLRNFCNFRFFQIFHRLSRIFVGAHSDKPVHFLWETCLYVEFDLVVFQTSKIHTNLCIAYGNGSYTFYSTQKNFDQKKFYCSATQSNFCMRTF